MVTMAVVVVKFPAVSFISPAVAGVVAVALAPPAFKTSIRHLSVSHVACDTGASSTAYARTDNRTRATAD
jgi:hypothetical protein